ncbi:MAG: TonB-dependent receptor [Chitinophagaceae bacterium]|nr:TonB-dependent receptor [Chitinophagaceae bacterium]
MKMKLLFALSLLSLAVHGQFKQQLRGTVVDGILQKNLAGATVSISGINQTVITDAEGVFRFKEIPVGSYRIVVTYAGFKEAVLDNIAVNSGKETVLTISLEALVRTESEIILKANSKKNKPLNDMSVVSARAFTVEETQRYAAAVNDPLRMAAAFPGVLANDDGNNNIVIRGNSPTGLLWRMEGLDIPSPNHFSQPGLSGGGISILSSQLLSNSDFVTAAFAAEYGNALSGVFDIKLRKGNNEKREYSLQAGVLGLNAAIEGPFSKKYKGSYLVNYRYSTLTLLNKIGVLPDDNVTNFQDLSYNIYLPTNKLGTFTLFGFGGLSDQDFNPDKDSSKWETKSDRYRSRFISNTGMSGITHSILAGKKLKINSAIGVSSTKIGFDEDYTEDDLTLTRSYIDKYNTRKLSFNTNLQYKFSNKLNLRAGFTHTAIHYRFYRLSSEHEGDPLEEILNTRGNTATQQAFAQWQYKPANEITLNAGLHYLRLSHNNTSSAEPRFSARWNINNRSSIGIGYGLHSQVQTLNVYFAQQQLPNGDVVLPNKDIDLTRSHHYVLSYSYRLAKNTQLKAEIYYQRLFNVPVATHDSSTLSTLNVEYEYITDPLVNKGKGRNYGVEISLERYLHNNFYFTLSNSIYQSKYTAADGIERNTRFNGNYIVTLITGKDFVNERKSKTIGVNIKTIYAGGLRTTPIDLDASRQAGYTVYRESEAYSLQNPSYFRTDLRISMKWNRKRVTSTLSLDIQNLTNRLNIFNQYYDDQKEQVTTMYQTGLIPILNYKIEF